MKEIISNLFLKAHKNPRAVKLYLGFLSNVVFKSEQVFSLEHKLKSMLEKVQANENEGKILYNVNLIYNESSVLIEIGGEPKNLGRILNLNQAVYNVFGYTKTELEFGNVNSFLPLKMQRFHDNFLLNYVKTGKSNILNQERNVLVRNKRGFYFCLIFYN